MPFRTFIAAVLIVLVAAGCSAKQPQGQPANESAGIPPGMAKPAGGTVESYFNPYNCDTASDGRDVYYSVLGGIYKIPAGAGGAEMIIAGETIVSIALHDSVVYYVDNAALCRVDKDGSNQMTFAIGYTVLLVGCLNDTLYISTNDGYYTADIASDPDIMTLVKHTGRPAPNGVFYSMEPIPYREAGCSLFRISPEIGGKTEILHDVLYGEYIITENSIFYHDEDGIYKSDLYGQNSVKLIDKKDTDMGTVVFFNYDDQWVYIGLSPGGFNRMNRETGELRPLAFDTNPGGFDIVDGYLYGYDHGEKARMKLPDQETEIAPFE